MSPSGQQLAVRWAPEDFWRVGSPESAWFGAKRDREVADWTPLVPAAEVADMRQLVARLEALVREHPEDAVPMVGVPELRRILGMEMGGTS